MDPHSFIARAEAQRWLGIAEKLLMSRDLVGSKTFAIRARESEPRLEPADQILAIADTLLAAEKRVGSNNQMDWYSILQLVRLTHDSELIAGQYRRLAMLLNPNKTQLPYADQAFQLVSEAWLVLSNPLRKSLYDSEINFQQHQQQFNPLGFQDIPHPQQQHHHQHHHQQHNFFSQSEPQFEIRAPPQQQQHQQHNFFSLPIEQPVPVQPFQSKPSHQQQHQQQSQPPLPQRPPQQQQPQQQPQRQPPPPAPPQPQQQQRPEQQQQQQQQRPEQQQQLQQRQRQQQPQPSVEQNVANVQGPREGGSNGVTEEEEREMSNAGNVENQSSFWTACPFCFHMYEYFKVYAECTMRCQHCKRAFQAVAVSSPPPIVYDGGKEEAAYYCWGFFPIGLSASSFEKSKGKVSNWAPFSPMFAGPAPQEKKRRRNYYTGPRIYIDDHVDDVFMGISEPSEDSDIDWGSTRKKKKKKSRKMKGLKKKHLGLGRKRIKQVLTFKRAEDVNMENGGNMEDVIPVQDGVVLLPNVSVAETCKKAETSKKAESNKKAVGTAPRRQSGRVAKELGKLDLNVEFNNNEGEEPAPGMAAGNRGGHGEEDNIEGIGFFEGLDEFLSSLPILSVVGDDKVKAA